MDTSGNLSTLTIPSNYTLRQDVPARFQAFSNLAVLVNTPNVPLTVDATGTVRPLTPAAPAIALTAAAGTSGGLTGTYGGLRYTYLIKDAIGNTLAESDFSPPSNTVTITSSKLEVTGVLPSPESAVNARRIYRPTSNGAVLFPWFDIDGNIVTTAQDDTPDASLSIVAAPTNGTPPRLTLVKEWRNILWGVGVTQPDTLFFTQAGLMWSWPAANSIVIPGTGSDQFGIRALMPRREALGVARRDIIWQITGTDSTNFTSVKLAENLGVESNESVATYRDTVWWLWKDGVYQWDDNGIKNISDLGGVKSWFTTGNTFNQNMFQFSFAVFDPVRLKYRLFLAGAGSTVIDHWIEYDIEAQTWWGPHLTNAFSPTCALPLADSSDKVTAVAGSSSGYIWQEQSAPFDDTNVGIPVSVDTKFFSGDVSSVSQFQGQVIAMSDFEKYWGELVVVGKVQSQGGTLVITPRTGYLDAEPQDVIPYDMSQGRQRLRRIGNGKLMQLNFSHSAAGESVELYGFELPYSIIGRR